MAINYLAALKLIPWDDVVRAAPTIVEGSKKLWNSVAKKAQSDATDLEARVSSLEAQTSDLQQEIISSANLIKALADQNSQLIQAVEFLRARMRLMIGAVAVLGVIVVGVVGVLLAR